MLRSTAIFVVKFSAYFRFVKRKKGERGSSEEKEDIGFSLKNLKMLRSPPEEREFRGEG